jgi:hypothetical protein
VERSEILGASCIRRRDPAAGACVHNACSVYIALPSPWSEITLRSGHAMAAPVATGTMLPIAPPVRFR